MGIKVFNEPQILEEADIIEFDLNDLEPKLITKYFYNGKEINFSQFYLLHLSIRNDIMKKYSELQRKELGKDHGIFSTGMQIFKYRIERHIHLISQIDVVKYEKIPEIKKDSNKIVVILHKREIYPNIWEFKPKEIDDELERGLEQYLLDTINMAQIIALPKQNA
jgi:ferritin-like protein